MHTMRKGVENCKEKYFYVKFDLQHIYSIFLVARETELHGCQYKIINRYLHYNVALKLWQKEETDQCVTCGLVDTIEHCLYEYDMVQKVWQQFLHLVE